MSDIYDNWERLVEVVLRREQLRQLALISSSEPSSGTVSPSISGWSTPIHDDQDIQLGSSSSTVDEIDWERLLPPDYEDIISRSMIPVAYATKKDLYESLCSSPILLDGGKMSFHIDKTTGKKCYMIGAMELNPEPFNYYWKLTPHVGSRFSKAAVLRNFWEPYTGYEIEIRGKIETRMLSPKTRYVAYLVYRFETSFKDLQPAKGIINFVNLDEDHDAERRGTTLHFQPGLAGKSQQIAVSRPDGWMEVQLGMFYNDPGSDGPVSARLLKSDESKIDLFIEGIEFRPANAKIGFVSKENARNGRKGIFSKLRISG